MASRSGSAGAGRRVLHGSGTSAAGSPAGPGRDARPPATSGVTRPVTGAPRWPTFRAVASPRSTGSRWRDLPTAVWMLAPSHRHPRRCSSSTRSGGRCGSGQKRCDAQGDNCTSNGWDQYVDVARSDEFQHALWVTVKFALLTVPIGLVARCRAGRARRQVPARPRRVPLHLLVDDRHVGRRRQPDVAVPAAAGRRRARQRRLDRRPLPGRQVARPAARSRHGARRRSRRRASGPASGSRSCSSRPGCRASRATCTRRPSSTAPAASGGSGASPCRCSARRCCSCSSC